MKILVTGGMGYIGSHTCVELLNDGYEIVVIDDFSNSKPEVEDKIKTITGKDFKFYEGDIRDRALLNKIFEENKIDAVMHFAGYKAVGESVKKPLMYYDNNLNSEEEGLIAGKLPTLNWSDDEYTNWLTQNSVNIALGVASAGITIVGGLGMMATGGGAVAGAGAVVNGAMSIANELGAVYQHSLQPNSAKGNVNGGDINVCDHKNGFYFYKMTIKEEYARIIDNYFSMFGYKINRVKVPNITGRSNWNYVKTINCNFDGDIPQTDLNIIKQMFDNGVTLWHNPSTMYDYSQSNNII